MCIYVYIHTTHIQYTTITLHTSHCLYSHCRSQQLSSVCRVCHTAAGSSHCLHRICRPRSATGETPPGSTPTHKFIVDKHIHTCMLFIHIYDHTRINDKLVCTYILYLCHI